MEHEKKNGVLTIKLSGRLNTQTMPAVEKEVQALIKGESRIVFDMRELEYIASCGLRLLVSVQKQLAKVGGTQILRNVNSTVRETLEITGLDSLLSIE